MFLQLKESPRWGVRCSREAAFRRGGDAQGQGAGDTATSATPGFICTLQIFSHPIFHALISLLCPAPLHNISYEPHRPFFSLCANHCAAGERNVSKIRKRKRFVFNSSGEGDPILPHGIVLATVMIFTWLNGNETVLEDHRTQRYCLMNDYQVNPLGTTSRAPPCAPSNDNHPLPTDVPILLTYGHMFITSYVLYSSLTNTFPICICFLGLL